MMQLDEMTRLLNQLCPMNALVDPTGHIHSVGPTLQKLKPDQPMAGHRFLELFEPVRPRTLTTMPDLMGAAGAKLKLSLRGAHIAQGGDPAIAT